MDFKKWREHWKSSFGEKINIEGFVEDGIVNPEEWNEPENKEKILGLYSKNQMVHNM